MKKIGVISPPIPMERFLKLASLASDMGYHSIWAYELIFDRDPVVQLTEALRLNASSGIKVGTGCLNPFVRTPLTIAMTFMTLEEMYPGRTLLGLGIGVLGWLDRAGVFTKRTHTGIRESVDIIRSLFQGKNTTHGGKVFNVHDLKMDLKPVNVPILLTPRENVTFAEICGEIGDGSFGPIGVSPAPYKRLYEHIRAGLQRSGRTDKDFMFVNNFCTVADRTKEAARVAMCTHSWFAHALGIAGSLKSWVEGGLDPKLYKPYCEAEAKRDFATTVKLLEGTQAHTTFGICGDRESVAEQIKGWVEAVGLDVPVISVCAHNEAQMIETLEAGRLYAEQA